VKRIYWQTPATGSVAWKSRLTDLPGDGLDGEAWSRLRICDKRIHDHLRWSVDAGCEGMKTVSEACAREGMEFHLSFRMNLFWRLNHADEDFARFINGRWWFEHPELRVSGKSYIDYALPAARKFVCDLIVEAATLYHLDGFCLDLTRWPPIFCGSGHDSTLLPAFLKEIRAALDAAGKNEVKLGFTAVEGYHAGTRLAEQHIDLRLALESGAVDYFGVQSPQHAGHSALAKEFGVEYVAVIEQEPIEYPNGYRSDPLWQDPVLKDSDPIVGEEFWDTPRVGGTLSPQEYDIAAMRAFAEGADGICYTNNDYTYQLGAAADSKATAERVKNGNVWGQVDGQNIFILT
jgi:hypothetical protein